MSAGRPTRRRPGRRTRGRTRGKTQEEEHRDEWADARTTPPFQPKQQGGHTHGYERGGWGCGTTIAVIWLLLGVGAVTKTMGPGMDGAVELLLDIVFWPFRDTG